MPFPANLPDPEGPEHGEYIHLIGPDGETDGRYSKVQSIISADYDGHRWEVMDTRGRQLIIQHLRGTIAEWIELEEV